MNATSQPEHKPGAHRPRRPPSDSAFLSLAALSAVGGLVHAAAAGSHTEFRALSLMFATAAVFQLAWASCVALRPTRQLLVLGAAANLAMMAFWFVSKQYGISGLPGLEQADTPQLADTVATVIEVLVMVGAAWTALRWPVNRTTAAPAPVSRSTGVRTQPMSFVPATIGTIALLFAIPAIATPHSHDHARETVTAASADGHTHSHDAGTALASAAGTDGSTDRNAHSHGDTAATTATPTAAHQARADRLVLETESSLARWKDAKQAIVDGYEPIGDAMTGYEHYVNWKNLDDDHEIDPQYPESLVYRINFQTKEPTLVSALYILTAGKTMDDVPDLAGSLIPWHGHDNLCWIGHRLGGTLRNGACYPGGELRPSAPMFHVWLEDTKCGRFAGLDGPIILCGDHHRGSDASSTAGKDSRPDAAIPSDSGNVTTSAKPTKTQQAHANKLVNATEASLTRFTDTQAATAAGYESIGDSVTGYEHFVNWAYLEDDHQVDAQYPESLVYRVERGTRQRTLVSALYILDAGTKVEDVADVGGPLISWHDHQNLCWIGHQVVGTSINGTCAAGELGETSPMFHVWIEDTPCGRFAGIDEGGNLCATHTHSGDTTESALGQRD